MYNAEAFIKECLDSVASQTYENLEIIVIDDDSTDSSAEIVATYSKKRKIIYAKVQNKNAAKTRRDGLKKATSDLVCFVDSDDVIHEDYVTHLYEAMRETRTELAVCKIETFTDEPIPSGAVKRSLPRVIESNADSFANHYHITETNKLTLQTLPCKLFKKDLFKDIDYTVLEANIFEDNFIMVQVLRKVNTIAVVDEGLYWYRQVSGSTSGGTIATMVEHNGVRLNSVEFFKDVVMAYCKKMLNGPNVDDAIERLSAAEFFNYARMVPDLLVRKEYLEQKAALDEARLKENELRLNAILDSASYKLGHTLTAPARKLLNGRAGKR